MQPTTTTAAEALQEKIRARTARVGVVGLGYVGLPLAVEFARAGFHVTGIDVQETKVDALNRGESYIQDVPTAALKPHVESGKFVATADFSVGNKLRLFTTSSPPPMPQPH